MTYSLVNRKCVENLPTSLRNWSGRIADPTDPRSGELSPLKIVDLSTQMLRPEAQLLLYVYQGQYQEWEVVIHDEMPSHKVSTMYAKSLLQEHNEMIAHSDDDVLS